MRTRRTGPSAARRTRLAPEVRRQQIIDAAAELFRQRPQDEVSLDEIANTIGVTRALINHHFGTKRDLYLEVIRRALEVNPLPVPDYVLGTTPEQRLRDSLDDWFAYLERNRDLWVAAIRSGGMGDAEILAIVEAAREDAAARVIAILGLGPLDAVSDEEMALVRGWLGFGEAIVMQCLEYGRLTREQASAAIVAAGVQLAERVVAGRGDAEPIPIP